MIAELRNQILSLKNQQHEHLEQVKHECKNLNNNMHNWLLLFSKSTFNLWFLYWIIFLFLVGEKFQNDMALVLAEKETQFENQVNQLVVFSFYLA